MLSPNVGGGPSRIRAQFAVAEVIGGPGACCDVRILAEAPPRGTDPEE